MVVGYLGEDGKERCLVVDLVIGVDGLYLIVRGLLNVFVVKEYFGYVFWRGIVCEVKVLFEMVRYF